MQAPLQPLLHALFVYCAQLIACKMQIMSGNEKFCPGENSQITIVGHHSCSSHLWRVYCNGTLNLSELTEETHRKLVQNSRSSLIVWCSVCTFCSASEWTIHYHCIITYNADRPMASVNCLRPTIKLCTAHSACKKQAPFRNIKFLYLLERTYQYICMFMVQACRLYRY